MWIAIEAQLLRSWKSNREIGKERNYNNILDLKLDINEIRYTKIWNLPGRVGGRLVKWAIIKAAS